MSEWVVQIIIAVLTFASTLVVNYFAFIKETNTRLAKLETANEVFWKVLDPHLASIIHSPVHKDRDSLVDAFLHNEIKYEELEALRNLLNTAVAEEQGDKKLAALLLLARVQQRLAGVASK